MNAQAFRNHPSAFDGWIEVAGMVLEVKRLCTRSGRPFTGLVVDQFHDIGKVVTVGSEAFPALLRNLRHESEGLWLLAPHLGWLETPDFSTAAVLRYIFDFVATPAAERKQAKYLVADMVVMLDRLSAGADRVRGVGDLLPMAVMGMAANDPCYRKGHSHDQP